MPIEITVPRLGWSMEEGIFVGWLKADGDSVASGEPLFALESEKVTMEVESLDQGVLHIPAGAPEAGGVVTVGQLLGFLLEPGEVVPVVPLTAAGDAIITLGLRLGDAAPNVSVAPRDCIPSSPRARATAKLGGQAIEAVFAASSPRACATANATPDHSGVSAHPASPRARAAAKKLGVDIANVQPREGAPRIIEADVLRHAPARTTIAARLEESFRAPHFYLHADAHVEALAALRHEHRPANYNDFLIKAIAIALVRHPRVNAYWDNGAVVSRTTQHIALAAQIGDTLYTPVIQNPAEKSLAQIARDREQALAQRSHGKDASATLSNLGPFGVDRFEAILNPPQSVIVAVGKIAKRPVVVDDQVVARLTMPISLSVDHRVVDGVPAAQFLQTLIAILESPESTYNEWE